MCRVTIPCRARKLKYFSSGGAHSTTIRKLAAMSKTTPLRVYPVSTIPTIDPIEVVIHEPIIKTIQDKVSTAAESRFAQALADFVQDLSISLVELPHTIQDIQETWDNEPVKPSAAPHDILSLAEMGLSGYVAPKIIATSPARESEPMFSSPV